MHVGDMYRSSGVTDQSIVRNTTTPANLAGLDCIQDSPSHLWPMCAAAVAIIVIFSFLEKRSNPNHCVRFIRPGITYPINLLERERSRLGYAAAFGSSAGLCFSLFNQSNILFDVPEWSKTLVIMATVLLYGIIVYPLFVCLSTQWVVAGAVIGATYSAFWFATQLLQLIDCTQEFSDLPKKDILEGQYIAGALPVLVCLLFVTGNFLFVLGRRFIQWLSEVRSTQLCACLPEEEESEIQLAQSYHQAYVRELLRKKSSSDSDPRENEYSLFKYKNDPTFKYSPRIVAIFTVAIICLYQFGILILLLTRWLYDIVDGLLDAAELRNTTSTAGDDLGTVIGQARQLLIVMQISVDLSFCVCMLFSVYSAVQILVNYRANIKRMYRGDFQHLSFQKSDLPANRIMFYSLTYAGSQVAYILWGFLIPFSVGIFICLIIVYVLVFPALGRVPWTLSFLLNILPGFVAIVVVNVILVFASNKFIQKRDVISEDRMTVTQDKILALENRKLYHNFSYFLFFFYIVLGLFGCLWIIMKGTFLGVVHISRLDRCKLMSGFERWDAGFMAYTSFLHLEATHRNPLLLVFCQLLLKAEAARNRDKRDVSMARYGAMSDDDFLVVPHVRQQARLRWYKAYTLVRNQSLVAANSDLSSPAKVKQ